MNTSKMLENAHKFTYLVKLETAKELSGKMEEDEKLQTRLSRAVSRFGVPAIEINTAIWYATELGFITEPDKVTGDVEVAVEPEMYQLGTEIEQLQDMIVYGLTQLAKRPQDFEETYVLNWCYGYPAHAIDIALANLLDDHRMASYELTDPEDTESTYLFYTLPENYEHQWGKNSFKRGEVIEGRPEGQGDVTKPVIDDTPEEDKALAAEQAKVAESDDTTTTTTEGEPVNV